MKDLEMIEKVNRFCISVMEGIETYDNYKGDMYDGIWLMANEIHKFIIQPKNELHPERFTKK